MNEDPLLIARKRIAKSSIKKAFQRINLQKQQHLTFSEIELQEVFDEKVLHFSNFKNLCTQYGDSSAITKGKFSHHGIYFATVGASGQGIIWDTMDYNNTSFCQPMTHLKGNVKLCDVSFHPRVDSIPGFAPNIITGTSEGEILVWTFDKKVDEQKCIPIKAHKDRVNATKYHPDGYTFFGASYDQSWSLWDATKLKELCSQKGHLKQIHSLDIHPDGSLIFTGDLGGYGMLWDIRTGKGIYEIGIENSILCCSFHPNGYELAIGGQSNKINIFDLRRKKELKRIPAHTKLISDLEYNSTGHILVSSSHDNTIKIWNGRDYSLVNGNIQQLNKVSSISVQDDKIGVTMIDRKFSILVNSHIQLTTENQVKRQQ